MSNRLKELRKNKGLTLKDIQEQIGIKRSTYSDYENEKTEPKLETWKKLADYFKVPIGYLQGISSPKNEDEYYKALIQQAIHSSNRYMQNDDDIVFKGWLMFITSLYEQSKTDGKLAESDDLISALSLISNEIVLGIKPYKGTSGVEEGLDLLNKTIKELRSKKYVVHGDNEILHLSDSEYSSLLEAQNKKASDDKPETEG